MMDRKIKGMAAENVACRFLELQGYEIIERNFAAKTGEIDIIAKDGDFFVFVEVKYRRDASFGYPSEAVDRKKQQKIRKTAAWYLKVHHPSDFAPARFDVVEILGKKIRVIKNAF